MTAAVTADQDQAGQEPEMISATDVYRLLGCWVHIDRGMTSLGERYFAGRMDAARHIDDLGWCLMLWDPFEGNRYVQLYNHPEETVTRQPGR